MGIHSDCRIWLYSVLLISLDICVHVCERERKKENEIQRLLNVLVMSLAFRKLQPLCMSVD